MTQSPVLKCTNCEDAAWVCENHPNKPWGGLIDSPFVCECGAGMPCGVCNNSDYPANGPHFIEGEKQ